MREFDELRMRVRPVGPGRYLVLANGPAQGAAIVTAVDEPARLRAEFDELIDIEIGRAPRSAVNVTTKLRGIGRDVFGLLFPDGLEDFAAGGNRATANRGPRWRQERGLRLRFDLPAELHDLPVETLMAPATRPEQAVALVAGRSLVRTLPSGMPQSRLPEPDDKPDFIHLLVAVASPDDPALSMVDADRELAALQDDVHGFGVKLTVLRHATRRGIEGWLDEHVSKPAAVLLIAHGDYDAATDEGVVFLEADDGTASRVPANLLSGILVRAQQLRLVVLNLCSSAANTAREPFAGLAQALIGQGIPAVVGMRAVVTDHAAGTFGPLLLKAICSNKTVDEAVTAARQHVSDLPGLTTIEWATPALFLHEECGHGWLFKVKDVSADRDETDGDPLSAGQAAYVKINAPGRVHLPDLLMAARYLRDRHDWENLLQHMRTSKPSPEQEMLASEARLELAWPRIERICQALAAGDPDTAGSVLASIRDQVPESVMSLLDGEVKEARLDRVYTLAEADRNAQRWAEALQGYARVLSERSGYREAEGATRYVHGRIAEAEEDWQAAVAAYQDCGEIADGPARLSHARGQRAAAAGDWARAHQIFAGLPGTADGLPGTPGGPCDTASGLAGIADWDVQALVATARAALYDQGLAAEGTQDWHGAAGCYHELPADYQDAGDRGAYASARIAASAGDWADARTRFAALPASFLDVADWLRYATGREADEAGDWPAVIEGFGGLPDAYADGEVGRRRQFARASVAEARGDSESVLAHLGTAQDTERNGQVGLMRWKTSGRLAEQAGDWAAAASAYGRVADTDPALGSAHRYALGRCCEQGEDWPGALGHYESLPDGHADARARRGYASARLGEGAATPDWRAILNAYDTLPPGFEDAARRGAYARLRLAVEDEAWETAIEAAGQAMDFPDAPELSDYARGRAAEERQDWAQATATYLACSSYGDAASRHAYAHGRELELSGQWQAAIAAYAACEPGANVADALGLSVANATDAGGNPIANVANVTDAPGEPGATAADAGGAPIPGVADAASRRARLSALLTALPWAEGVANAPLVADPLAELDPTFPYLALRQAGITPASSTAAVNEASYTLMEQGGMTWQERVAWNDLCSPAGRLLQDALLHRFRAPEHLTSLLAAMDTVDGSALAVRLGTSLPEDAPLLTLLTGDRATAMEAWRHRLRSAPADMVTIHCLAVASYWQARRLQDTGAWEQAEPAWREALACWAVLLTDDGYWAGWRQERAGCYGHAVTPADTARLRIALGGHLTRLLSEYRGRHADAGRPEQAAQYLELTYLLEAELDGARSLSEAGGMPLPGEEETRLACGPGYLRVAGLSAALSEFVLTAERQNAADPDSDGETLRRVRWAFSELSETFSHAEHHRFEQALRGLRGQHLRRMADLPPDCASPSAAHESGYARECPQCAAFMRHNPAYARLPRRGARLLQDAILIAVRVHLCIARDLLPARPDEAMAALSDAIGVSAGAAMAVRTKQAVLRMVLGRVDALTDVPEPQIDRLNEAIALVRAARPALGKLGSGALAAKLADLLVDRGAWYRLSCQDVGVQPDIAKSLADLREALELNPESARARVHLSRALIFGRDRAPGIEGLLPALRILDEGLNRAPANNRLIDGWRVALEQLEPLLLAGLGMDELAGLMREYGDDDTVSLDAQARARYLFAQALHVRDQKGMLLGVVRASRVAPADETIREALLGTLGAGPPRYDDQPGQDRPEGNPT